MSGLSAENEDKSLPVLFQEGLDLYNHIETLNEPTNSSNFQSYVKRTMKMFEDATRLVSMASLFSTNETLEDIPTENLQYLMLPALLGTLSLKLTGGERKTTIDVAEVYYKDFLQRSNDYGLSNYDFNEQKKESFEPRSQVDDLRHSVNTRADKIQRFLKQKELKKKLEDLKINMKNENVDDETKRSYFLTMLELFIYEAIDELKSIEMEKPILEHMAKLGQRDEKPLKRPPPPPLKPIIITRDEVQKAVFGAGYPALPTMTVQEFYDKRVQDGVFPDPTKPNNTPMSMQQAALQGVSLHDDDKEAEDEEKKIEEDDPENIERMRARDEFKDEHRRGWGNRMNRS
ncbi:immunoglobulin-binding protein 1b [Onthophagus taurus]|uniref:immunoglobulin-binding protein 1b n=1 Tax=Onthophagus taurus TaxID=166361 RepID=UPI000C200E2F|nr:immunoglobulin-binding protein 1b [Onthophagus taurus]